MKKAKNVAHTNKKKFVIAHKTFSKKGFKALLDANIIRNITRNAVTAIIYFQNSNAII